MHIENIRKKHIITICPNNWTNNEMKGEYVILAFTNKQQDKIILSIRKKITSSQIIIKTKNNIPMLIKPQQLLLLLLFICIGSKSTRTNHFAAGICERCVYKRRYKKCVCDFDG